jgi:hypothetical protein
MAVTDVQASLLVLWCLIEMVRYCDWRDQFYCERFGAFMIVESCGPVAYFGERIIVALHNVCCQLPL